MTDKPNCSKHVVPSYLANLHQVAEDIGDMPYNAAATLFMYLSEKLAKDALNDRKGGRVKLATLLMASSIKAEGMEIMFQRIWELCEVHMKNESK